MTNKHTPLPWTNKPGPFFVCQVGSNFDDPGIWSEAFQTDGTPFPFGDKKDDAAFIVRACNSHYELLATLKELVEVERKDKLTNPDISATDAYRGEVWNKARAAISKAETP